ncbi:solute carrier family 49 member 4-like isoform X2 [Lineus longissimus]|uniref:solute carrier family 49 member 4-like isoform X2 n=1 Tax=Lineus longissimus TaxID=88925 RepID=UPI00315CEFDA
MDRVSNHETDHQGPGGTHEGVRGLPIVICHSPSDDDFENTPLLLGAEDHDEAQSPMPQSPASSRSSGDTLSLSSLESEGSASACSPETNLVVGSAPETRGQVSNTNTPANGMDNHTSDYFSKPKNMHLHRVAADVTCPSSSVPTGNTGEDKRTRECLKQNGMNKKLKSILKRRGSDHTRDVRKISTATFKIDCIAQAETRTERTSLLQVEGSDESRRVSYSLPDGHDETRQTLPSAGMPFRVYNTRYYVLFIFCAFGFIYGLLWNTSGPVAKTVKALFDFNNGDIALIANWGPIGFTLSLVIYTLIIQRKGLRWACLCSATIMFLGAGIRCLVAWQRVYARWFFNTGYLCVGLARFMAQVAAPVLSATWFKAEQRTTATATAVLMPQLGMALFSVVESYMVEEEWNTTGQTAANVSDRIAASVVEDRIFNEMMQYMYVLCLAGGICFAMWIFFPARPPSPPTKSASVMRMTLRRGFRMLYRNRNFWIVAIPANAVSGVLVGWISLIELIFEAGPYLEQHMCGWMIFGNVFGGLTAGLIIARASDRKVSRMKPLLLILMCGGFIAMLLFTLQVNQIIPSLEVTTYASCVLVGIFLYAALPLICEISAELAYPVQEHVALVMNIIIMNLATFFYLLPPLFPQVPVTWINWTFLGVIGVALPITACYKQKYLRAEHDKYLDMPADGIGTYKVNEWLRKDVVENEPLASDMNWIEDRRSSTATIGSIQEESSPVLRGKEGGSEEQGTRKGASVVV